MGRIRCLSSWTMLLLICATLCGCANQPAEVAAASRMSPVASAEVPVPPKELVEQVRQVLSSEPLSLGVESEEKGTLATGWKRYRGDWHIARYWQERTRYRVEVIPDWDEPAARSRITVTAETEQRPAEGQSWDREPRVPRPQRAQETLEAILQQLGSTGTSG